MDASVGTLHSRTFSRSYTDHLGAIVGQIIYTVGAVAFEQSNQRGRALSPPSSSSSPVRALPAVQLPLPFVQHGVGNESVVPGRGRFQQQSAQAEQRAIVAVRTQ